MYMLGGYGSAYGYGNGNIGLIIGCNECYIKLLH